MERCELHVPISSAAAAEAEQVQFGIQLFIGLERPPTPKA
jgi:hypothetical protein